MEYTNNKEKINVQGIKREIGATITTPAKTLKSDSQEIKNLVNNKYISVKEKEKKPEVKENEQNE